MTRVDERVGLFLKFRHELLLEVAVYLGAFARLRRELAEDRVELGARRGRNWRVGRRLLVWEDVGSRAPRRDARGRLAFVLRLKILGFPSGHYATHVVKAGVNPFLFVVRRRSIKRFREWRVKIACCRWVCRVCRRDDVA